MKSVWALGSSPHFSRPPPRPRPKRWPEPSPTSDWHDLVARALRVGEGIEERQQPGAPVGLGQTHDQPQDGDTGEHLEHGAQRDAAGEEHREGDAGEHQGRSHVGLLEHEQAGHAQDGRGGVPPRPPASSTRSARRASRSAAKTARASFISSDGWSAELARSRSSGPIPRRRSPMPGTSTATSNSRVHDEQQDAHPPPPVVAHPGGDVRRRWPRGPSTAPGARRSSTPTRSTGATCRPRPTAPSRARSRTGCRPRRSAAVRAEIAVAAARGIGRSTARARPSPVEHPEHRAEGPVGGGGRHPGGLHRSPPSGASAPVSGVAVSRMSRSRTHRAKSSPRARVGPVPVERRARRREHDRSRRPGHGGGLAPRRRPSTGPRHGHGPGEGGAHLGRRFTDGDHSPEAAGRRPAARRGRDPCSGPRR